MKKNSIFINKYWEVIKIRFILKYLCSMEEKKMKLKTFAKLLALSLILAGMLGVSNFVNADTNVYRLFNLNSQEHLYTVSSSEIKLLTTNGGFRLEGTAWVAPDTGIPVFRLYNPKSKEHFYTKDVNEKNNLIANGWTLDGVTFNSGGSVPVYRLYNKNGSAAQQHLWTADINEKNTLIASGSYKDEGIGWYALKKGVSAPAPAYVTNLTITSNNPFAPYGKQCTTYVWQYFFTNLNKAIPVYRGNAGDWVYAANSSPAANTIAVFPPGNQGAGSVGHVAVVKSVNSNGTINIIEGNFNGGWGTSRTVSTSGVKFIKP